MTTRLTINRAGVDHFRNSPDVARFLEREYALPAADAAIERAAGWEDTKGGTVFEVSPGGYGTRTDGGDAYVVANTGLWHLIEFGTAHTPGKHALEYGARDAGLVVE